MTDMEDRRTGGQQAVSFLRSCQQGETDMEDRRTGGEAGRVLPSVLPTGRD